MIKRGESEKMKLHIIGDIDDKMDKDVDIAKEYDDVETDHPTKAKSVRKDAEDFTADNLYLRLIDETPIAHESKL